MESGNIKPINRNSVHKICSGQVVLTLATAVKELVENSLDAGATIIEVKLKEYGSELVEVIDNGKGVKASDFQSITLKHHTSKINDFCDVESVSTFGFRGEALSSLCALSNVEIITCHEESSIGSLLTYNHDGTLIKSTPTPRQVGTTVILKNLFFTLPVRHKEFLRNIKREFSKMIQLLTAYCLISVNKKITCSNITSKGKKSILLSTNNCTTLKESIASIFGSKQVNNMMEFIQQCPSDAILEDYFVPKSSRDNYKMFQIEGFISNSTHGEGRSSTDRQFFFINGRPCDLPKISKLINEIYHSFNKHQYPFVFLNITLTEGSADVNVTPDKRLIFIQEEKLLLCIVKTSLLQMYQIQPSQIKMSSPSLFFHKKNADSCTEQLEEKLPVESEDVEETLKRKINSNTSDFEESPPFSPPYKTLRKEGPCNIDQKSVEDEVSVQDSPDSGFVSVEGSSASSASYPSSSPSNLNSPSSKAEHDKNQLSSVNMTLTLPYNEDKAFKGAPLFKSGNLKLEDILQKAYRGKNSFTNLTKTSNKTEKINKSKTSRESSLSKIFFKNMNKDKVNNEPETLKSVKLVIESISRDDIDKEISQSEDVAVIEEEYALLDEYQSRRKRTKMITFDIETIKANFKLKKNSNLNESLGYRKFRSKIAPTDNQSAEEELKKEIRKEDFTKMDIIGQFNLGFIITRLNSDLFIIDQHATDEKYNFEMLQKETVLETQKLLNPQNLDLTAVSEAVLLDNLNIFEKSGFKFNVSEEKSVGQKIQLVSVPVSHNWRFGKEDVDEMIFMLTDNPISMVRPSRVNQMFASRACRKSVMIGTALTVSMMKKLVFHMGEIEQPWNCPHGRPTMRHLLNLNILDQSSDN